MADHRQIMELAQKGALAKKQERYQDLLGEISSACAALQRASLMLLPGSLDDIKEGEIALAAKKLQHLLPEARALKAELEKAGVYVW
jgi:hypothetical protein